MNPETQVTETTTVTDTIVTTNESNRKKLLLLGAGLLLAIALIVAAILLTQQNNGQNTSTTTVSSSTTISAQSSLSSQGTQTSQTVSSTTSSNQGEARTTTIKFGAVGEEDTFTFAYTLPNGFSVNMVDKNNMDRAYSFFDLINNETKVTLSFGTSPDGFPTAVEGMAKIKSINNQYHQGINRGLVENDTQAIYGMRVTTGSECAFRDNDSDVCLSPITVTTQPIPINVYCYSTDDKVLNAAQLAACDQIVSSTKFTVQAGS